MNFYEEFLNLYFSEKLKNLKYSTYLKMLKFFKEIKRRLIISIIVIEMDKIKELVWKFQI